MIDDPHTERSITDLLADSAPARAPARLRTDIRCIARSNRQRRRWIALLKEPPMRLSNRVAVGSPMARLAAVAVTSLALVVAIAGGVIAGASPAPSEPAPPPVPAPTTFTGSLSYGECSNAQQTIVRKGVMSRRGDAKCFPPVIEPFTDPRLRGDVVIWWNDDTYSNDVRIEHGGFTITNAEGSWQQVPDINVVGPDGVGTTRTSVFVGQGAYEGLTAIAEISLADAVWSFKGIIIEGEIPPAGPSAPTFE